MSGTTAPDQRFGQLATSLQPAGHRRDHQHRAGPERLDHHHLQRPAPVEHRPELLRRADEDRQRQRPTRRDGALPLPQPNHPLELQSSERAHTVFDFGVVSKGPLSLSGNVDLAGVNINVESNAYIESLDNLLALSIIGNSSIAGNVKIVNPLANVCLIGGQAGVGGETGQDAMKHIEIGVAGAEFPDMAPGVFESYATNLLSSSVDLKSSQTLTNVRIPAGMNPKFTAQTTIRGVLFIEAPNVVEFAGGASVTGVIVTNGSQTDDSGTNQLNFTGTVDSHPVTSLPQEAQFAGLQSKIGTFIIAPGFAVSFGGNFSTLNGAIAANGVSFFGNAGGMIRGSVINYANKQMTLSGNSDLLFNRSGLDKVPAGFVPDIVLNYDRSSYSEVVL